MGWQDRHTPRKWLTPLSWLYGFAVWARNVLYDKGWLRSTGFSVPVISVGNIAAGGTGKTPHVAYLTELLGKEFRVAVLSRGYRRRTRDFREVTPSSSPADTGDEPLLLKRRFPGATVAVDRDRVHGVSTLMTSTPPPGVVLLDDAFQHRAIRPGFSILLVDFSRPLHRDMLLPAGMLREPARNLRRAHMAVVTRTPASLSREDGARLSGKLGIPENIPLFFTGIAYGDWIPVYANTPGKDAASSRKDPGSIREQRADILLVTGIASPAPLLEHLRSVAGKVNHLAFPDHYRYRQADMGKIRNEYLRLKETRKKLVVVTTEKDAVKLRELDPGSELRSAFFAIRISVSFPFGDQDAFDRQIKDYVSSHQRSSRLHQE